MCAAQSRREGDDADNTVRDDTPLPHGGSRATGTNDPSPNDEDSTRASEENEDRESCASDTDESLENSTSTSSEFITENTVNT